MPTKTVVAMSGGVDSSVAAALLKEQGHDVIGITMNLSCSNKSSDKGCCGSSAAIDAKKVADALRIPHYTVNFKKEFEEYIIKNFIDEYKAGRTPNPCVRCNQYIKFELLLKKAFELGAGFVATGHYAQIALPARNASHSVAGGHGTHYSLLKGKDTKKDQTYFLYTVTQEALAHTLFPVGNMTKPEVRKIAKDLNLPVHDKKESQEICFIEDDDYVRFIKENVPEAVKPGNIINEKGNIVGRHEGIAFYTIGQRKGIGAHFGLPKYVIKIDKDNNTIIIGDQKELENNIVVAQNVTLISGTLPSKQMEISAKIRYNCPEAKGLLTRLDDSIFKIEFESPQRAITPGQSVVFYKGDEVLGGGLIKQGGN